MMLLPEDELRYKCSSDLRHQPPFELPREFSMNDNQLIDQVKAAKDDLGVITNDALSSQLASWSPQDWKRASEIFAKGACAHDGFFIEDNGQGQISIHNDMSKARTAADVTIAEGLIQDGLMVDAVAVPALLAAAPLDGFLAPIIGIAATGAIALSTGIRYMEKVRARDEIAEDSVVKVPAKGNA